MKIGTFPEAIQSLKERCRKNLIENRAVVISLWFQLAMIPAMICSYLILWISTAYAISHNDIHSHQSAPIDIMTLANLWRIGFWSCVIGLPTLALILSIRGILPGTRRKSC
jgi:hypothetical protein